MNTVFYQVSGIANQQMKTSLKNALDKMEGVQQVGIGLQTGTVKVSYNQPASEAQISACIGNSGFSFTKN